VIRSAPPIPTLIDTVPTIYPMNSSSILLFISGLFERSGALKKNASL